MARRLAAAGHQLLVWNRTRDKAERIAGDRVRIAATPADLAAGSDLIGICLSSHTAVEEFAFGPAGLFTAGHPRVQAVADFSTGAVEAAQDFARRAGAYGVDWVDAPVSGGVPAADRGELVVFAGGSQAGIDRLQPVFAAVAARVTRMGDCGSGQAAKLCNQAIVAATMLVIAETFAMARRAGIDPAMLPGAFAGGFADCAPLQIFGPRMANHRFEPRLGRIGLMIKDARLASALATRSSAEAPMLREVHRIYSTIAEGGDPSPEEDLSALIRLYEDGAQ
jgi:3-hydroxyisobutyrate dehydrogenase